MVEAGIVVLLFAVSLYVGGGLLLYATQSRLIHQPGVPTREHIATPDAIGVPWENVSVTTDDDVRLHGWFLPAPDKPRFTLMFFHGNAGNISLRLDSLKIFHELGLATLIIDYRGYGRSNGKPSEDGLYRDADATWQYLINVRDIPSNTVIAFGRSMGAAVAAHLAMERDVAGLILESAFISVPDLAAELYPIYPARLMARIEYPTKQWVANVDEPVLVVHSPDDKIIPYDHGRAVYQAAPEPKRFLQISGGHNEGFIVSGETYKAGLDAWLKSLEQQANRP